MSASTKSVCDIDMLCSEAACFARAESNHWEESLFATTDGKAVGTYLEHKFQNYISSKFIHTVGSSASGIDCPALNVDIKVTSIKQPQSSCPFKDVKQKIYGLGYSLLVFVYEKKDDFSKKAANLNILHTIFVDAQYTADYQTTYELLKILKNKHNRDDILAFIEDRRLPIDEIGAIQLAEYILTKPPQQGYLTISNALQWRLQYQRVIDSAGIVAGIRKL